MFTERYSMLCYSKHVWLLQAFLEMADEVSASTMVTYFTSCMAQLRGHAVYVQFSNHKELKTDQTHSNAVSSLLDTYYVLPYKRQVATYQTNFSTNLSL